jgi:phosphomannomutase
MAGIFKAYDIRGIYGRDLHDHTARDLGRAFATFLRPRRVVIGRDMRPHSEPLFAALADGLTLHGVEVIDLGLCTTPMSYFANGRLGADAGIMITASHNSGEWNGFKLCRAGAEPISGATGIAELERLVLAQSFDPPAATRGAIVPHDIRPAYAAHVRSFAALPRRLRIAADYANAMGIVEAEALHPLLDLDGLFDTLDGSFPNHEANPLDEETFHDLQRKVRGGGYDFGLAFDGDADRVGFTDERGEIVSMDFITALIAGAILAREKGVVLYDLRSSRATREWIAQHGGQPQMCRVGHAFIKKQMRESGAVFAGELSGHYYFRENFHAESSALAVLFIANLVAQSGKPLSALVAPLRRYSASGEINSRVQDPAAVFAALRAAYPDGQVHELDGLSVDFPDWWFNVRMSNTEPLCRLNLEAATPAAMAEHRDRLLALIRAC